MTTATRDYGEALDGASPFWLNRAMQTYRIILTNGSETDTRAYSAEMAMRQAIAIFGEHVDRIERA